MSFEDSTDYTLFYIIFIVMGLLIVPVYYVFSWQYKQKKENKEIPDNISDITISALKSIRKKETYDTFHSMGYIILIFSCLHYIFSLIMENTEEFSYKTNCELIVSIIFSDVAYNSMIMFMTQYLFETYQQSIAKRFNLVLFLIMLITILMEIIVDIILMLKEMNMIIILTIEFSIQSISQFILGAIIVKVSNDVYKYVKIVDSESSSSITTQHEPIAIATKKELKLQNFKLLLILISSSICAVLELFCIDYNLRIISTTKTCFNMLVFIILTIFHSKLYKLC